MGFLPSSSWLFGDKYQMLVEELGKDYEADRTPRKSPTLPGWSRGWRPGKPPNSRWHTTEAWRRGGTSLGRPALQAEGPGWVKARRPDQRVGLGRHQGDRWSHPEALYPEVLRAQTTCGKRPGLSPLSA